MNINIACHRTSISFCQYFEDVIVKLVEPREDKPRKMNVCRWQISWIVGFLLFLSEVIGEFDRTDYLKREHTLVKPYTGYFLFCV